MKKEAATLSVRVARRLLRRTRLLAATAQRGPAAPTPESAAVPEKAAPHVEPEARPHIAEEQRREEELAELRARAERAESAAAWLRARLRAERTQRMPVPQFDAAALAADLARDLNRLHTAHPEAVRRVVYRALAMHGLPVISQEAIERPAPTGGTKPAVAPWPREQQEMLAAAVLARTPEAADPAYVYRVLELLAQRGRLTLPDLTRAAGYSSAMARRRLRLTVEALAALGALALRDGAYTLNMDWTPPAPPREVRGPRDRDKRPLRA